MSNLVSALVWRHNFGKGGRKLVAARLADHADDEGRGIYPSQARVAAECNIDRRTVQRTLKDFVSEGILVPVKDGGRGPKSPTQYDMDLGVVCALPVVDWGQISDENKGGNLSPLEIVKGGIRSPKGGIESQKGRQDTAQTTIEPSNNHSSERASADLSDLDEKEGLETDRQRAKRLDKEFGVIFPKWPTYISDSGPAARAAFCALDDAERHAAGERMAEYLEATKQIGRQKTCSFARYLSERRWTKLPDNSQETAQAGQPDTISAKPFGKAWNACRIARLLRGPIDNMPAPTTFLQGQIDAGGDKRRKALLRHVATNGFPKVHEMIERAALGQAVSVPAEFVRLGECFEQCATDSELFAQWQAEFQRRGWPLEAKITHQWVWLPVPDNASDITDCAAMVARALEQFETALKDLTGNEGKNDDDCAA